MSYALSACVLIRLDARMGQWVPVGDLADHLGVSVEALQPTLKSLKEHRYLDLQRAQAGGPVTHARVDPAEHMADLP